MEARDALPTCPQCNKTFFRKAHMLRHVQQHTGVRPYCCQFCSKTFKRSDVLRDHFQRCELRGAFPIPKQEERGRKRHACDNCARLKVKCDNEMPCQKCKDFGRTCVKSRIKPPSNHDEAATADISTSDRSSINFLLNCPGDTEFTQRFPPDTKPEGSSPSIGSSAVTDYTVYTVPAGFGGMYPDKTPAAAFSDFDGTDYIMSLGDFISSAPFGIPSDLEWTLPIPAQEQIISAVPSPDFLTNPDLDNYADQIRVKLEQTAQNFPSRTPDELLSALQLIRGETIDRFVKLYFRNWHPHGPMVHEPSFNIFQAELPLLLGIFCVGGLYTQRALEKEQLRMLLDLIEHHVYHSPPYNDEYETTIPNTGSSPEEQLKIRLDEIQGGHLMVVAQFWSGSPMARKRARRQRWSRLVNVSRDVRTLSQQLGPEPYIQDEVSFQRWVLQQALRRTFVIMMLLDNAYVIFNNVPPHWEWFEVGLLEFPSEREFFDMASFQEMYNAARVPQPKATISDAMQTLFVPDLRNDAAFMKLLPLNAFDMNVLIHWLYVQVWRQTFASPTFGVSTVAASTVVRPLRVAVQNWKLVWDQLKSRCTPEQWAAQGFHRMAEMYWNLTKEVLIVYEKRSAKDCLPIICDCDTGLHLKDLLRI